jgi:hypothetical protein
MPKAETIFPARVLFYVFFTFFPFRARSVKNTVTARTHQNKNTVVARPISSVQNKKYCRRSMAVRKRNTVVANSTQAVRKKNTVVAHSAQAVRKKNTVVALSAQAVRKRNTVVARRNRVSEKKILSSPWPNEKYWRKYF